MQSWIRGSSSLLAIVGGALFLLLPLMTLNGVASIDYPPSPRTCGHCIVPLYHPPPRGMFLFWASLGIVGIVLGVFALILGQRPRIGLMLGIAFSLGSLALLFWTVTHQILTTLIVTPAGLLLLPELAVVMMAGDTVLLSLDLALRGPEVIEAVTS